MGTPWHQRLVCWSHPRPLPMPPHLDPQHMIQMHCDELQFFPTVLQIPMLSHQDATIRVAQELSHALKQQHNNPVSQLRALDQLSTLFTTMAPGVKPTMLNYSPPSQFNQHPNFPTHEPSPPAVPQPCYNLCPCLPTTPYTAPITHADTGIP